MSMNSKISSSVTDAWSRVADALRPPPLETLPQWIERVVRLPEGVSAEPGKVTLWPPQVEVATSIGDDTIELDGNGVLAAPVKRTGWFLILIRPQAPAP